MSQQKPKFKEKVDQLSIKEYYQTPREQQTPKISQRSRSQSFKMKKESPPTCEETERTKY